MILCLFNVLRYPVLKIKQHFFGIVQQMLHKMPVLSRQSAVDTPAGSSQLAVAGNQLIDLLNTADCGLQTAD
jgi:hypothetical protein